MKTPYHRPNIYVKFSSCVRPSKNRVPKGTVHVQTHADVRLNLTLVNINVQSISSLFSKTNKLGIREIFLMFSCSWISCFIVKTNKHNVHETTFLSQSCAFFGPCELKPCAVYLPEQLVLSRTKTDYSNSTTTVYLIVSFFILRASALLPPQSREAIN